MSEPRIKDMKIKEINTETEKNSVLKVKCSISNFKLLERNDDIKLIKTEENIFKDEKKKIGKKCLKKIIYNIIAFLYNLLAFLFYYLSLEGCFDKQSKCIPLLSTMFLGRILIFGMMFSIMISIELYLIINKIIYFFHLIYIILFYIVIYHYDHGSKLDHHGLYNFFLTLLLIIIFAIIFGIINIIIYVKKKKNKIYQSILFIIFFYYILRIIFFSISLRNSCRNWDKGLNSTTLDNSNEYRCQIKYPKKCLIYSLNDYFDMSYYLHKKCTPNSNQENEQKLFLKYLKLEKNILSKSNLTHFGIPLTVNNPNFGKNNFYNIYDFVYKNTILMELYNTNNSEYYSNEPKPEVEIFYDKKKKIRKGIININKNETLSKIRNEITNNITNENISLFNNVMLIYIDSVSRQHFLRKMKKTSAFIEKFMKYNNNLGFNSYQFMKYQSFAHFTAPNIIPMFYSSKDNYRHRSHLVKFFKQNGFVTGNTGNLCEKDSCELTEDLYYYNKLSYDGFDHENIGMFCDPNYSSEDSPYPIFSGPYSILRKCLYGQDTFKYMLEYGKKFWDTYPENKKFLRMMFQDGHEPTGQVVKYLDEYLYNFLEELYENKKLENTALFILSDHGNSYFNYIYYYILKSDDSMIEGNYATLFIMLPNNNTKNKINEEYYNNVYNNQQILISPYDIHNTLIHIALGEKTINNYEVHSRYGRSLLSTFEGKSRNCYTWSNIFEGECLCKY